MSAAQTESFIQRHIGPHDEQVQAMLDTVGVKDLEALVEQIVPANIRLTQDLDLDAPCSEEEALRKIRAIADKNTVYRSYIGQGYYGTHTPTVILRNILENPAWYTAYTPYQPEISQGRLEALLNFQTMICDLTGFEVANASLLDEATAAAEAMAMAWRSSKNKSNTFFISHHAHPQTIAVVQTRAHSLGIQVVVGCEKEAIPDCFGVLLQYPQSLGGVHDYRALTQSLKERGAVVVVATDLLALNVLVPPAQWGADIAVGSAQRFGVPMGYGGPHAGFMACKDAFKRTMPGRLVGVSIDAQGKPALRLALQTREQHIRREKATSNICTAQVLLAVMASMYAVYHGAQGVKAIAERVHRLTVALADGLQAFGVKLQEDSFFDTVHCFSERASDVVRYARERGINLRVINDEQFAISLDETVTEKDVQDLLEILSTALEQDPVTVHFDHVDSVIPAALQRQEVALKHEIFSAIHSETEMLRYLRQLADMDLALDRSMIPLGSCTMKLNATTEMIPVTWPEFANLHPFAPADQAQGYQELMQSLSAYLCAITGYDAVSLQPNSGAQGEYAGLLAIKAYHDDRQQSQRRICLIPSSAHGTNPASAVLAGFEVDVVAADAHGNVDLDDLAAKIDKAGDRLAALMITYPSTHGVFEEKITTICEMIHQAGGQVYLDGANMNAMVGLAQPGRFGSDVSHLNLHKTFAIPHGGGGPGVGPIGVKSHLAPYLPGNILTTSNPPVGPVSAAPYGSAGVLPISWMYIVMMGAKGLRLASATALLNANYIATRLAPYYPILYTGAHQRVAHECILDLRPLKETSGITVDDVAKRLIDYGFHAPTMSFPVPGTLMVEPTESESKVELDRFIDAMIQIHHEIMAVQDQSVDAQDNVLKNAPHTAQMATADQWDHPYTRQQAVYPAGVDIKHKYWPPVARIDNAYGDRHFICQCPSVDEYSQ